MSSENVLGGEGGGGGGGHACTIWFSRAEWNKFRRPRILIVRNILRSNFIFLWSRCSRIKSYVLSKFGAVW